MAVFTENQATQFYVAKTASATTPVTKSDDSGAVYVGSNKDGKYFLQVRGAGKTITRSAIIDPKTVTQVTAKKAADMQTSLKTAVLKLNSTVNSGAPVAGQDYTVNVFIKQYIGISDEDIHVKTGAVHAFSGDSAATFYAKMAASLWMNFSRELEPLLIFSSAALTDTLESGTDKAKIVAGVKANDEGVKLPVDEDGNFITFSDGVYMTEAVQEWTLGIKEQVPVYFTVSPTTIYVDGDETPWGVVTYGTAVDALKQGNGKKIADMEYFFHGERGDQYRNIMWPKSIPTEYLVDSEKEYHTLNIHFAYVGSNESVQKSEKDIMIVSETATVIDTIGKAIADAAGITYTKIGS